MKTFSTLVGLFLRDLARRRSLWIIGAVFIGMIGLFFLIERTVSNIVQMGESYDIATRQAKGVLSGFAKTVRGLSLLLCWVVGALAAPGTRKNGTTQFALSLPVSRGRLASSQFIALVVLISAALLIVHFGFFAIGYKYQMMSGSDVATSWFFLIVPCLMAAATAFTLSLSLSIIETYIIIIALPFLLDEVIPNLLDTLGESLPLALLRFAQNASLLFPSLENLVLWPSTSTAVSIEGPPFPDWPWLAAHDIFATGFWVFLGLWIYFRHDFGSRTPLK